jgi:hypothetical protein
MLRNASISTLQPSSLPSTISSPDSSLDLLTQFLGKIASKSYIRALALAEQSMVFFGLYLVLEIDGGNEVVREFMGLLESAVRIEKMEAEKVDEEGSEEGSDESSGDSSDGSSETSSEDSSDGQEDEEIADASTK